MHGTIYIGGKLLDLSKNVMLVMAAHLTVGVSAVIWACNRMESSLIKPLEGSIRFCVSVCVCVCVYKCVCTCVHEQ